MKIKVLDVVMVAFMLNAGRNVDVLSYVIWGMGVIYAICRLLEIKENF